MNLKSKEQSDQVSTVPAATDQSIRTIVRKIGLWGLWVIFILYVLFFAPPIQPDTLRPLQMLFSGQFPTVNAVQVSLFSMIGIWLLIYGCLMFADGRVQKYSAGLFLLASVGSGVVGLIPYLALREPNSHFSGKKDAWLNWFDARSTGILLTVSTIVLLAYAIVAGDWSAFVYEFQTNRFIHAMTLAFCLFCLLFPTLLGDDLKRRGIDNPQIFWAITLLPLFAPLVYLCLRPALPEQ